MNWGEQKKSSLVLLKEKKKKKGKKETKSKLKCIGMHGKIKIK